MWASTSNGQDCQGNKYETLTSTWVDRSPTRAVTLPRVTSRCHRRILTTVNVPTRYSPISHTLPQIVSSPSPTLLLDAACRQRWNEVRQLLKEKHDPNQVRTTNTTVTLNDPIQPFPDHPPPPLSPPHNSTLPACFLSPSLSPSVLTII